MHAVTPQFLETLTTSHSMVARVDVHYAGALMKADIPIADGSVTIDRGSKIRRTLSLTVSDPALLPWSSIDPLAVYGQTLVVRRGIRYANGLEETVPLGTFRIDEPQGDVHLGPVTLTGKSSECYIIDDKFLTPKSTRGYSNCVDAITALIRETLPDAVVVNATSDGRNPSVSVRNWDANSDRWDAVQQIALAMQADIYVDPLDRFVITDVPQVLSSRVVWSIDEGEGGTLMSASRQMSRTAVFNAVVASGENSSSNAAPVSYIAYDSNTSSPTRWGGPFGRVPKFISSALWTTVGACQAAAQYALFDAIAPNIATTIDAVPNPALEGGDCLRISYAGRKELFILQSATIPLTADGNFTVGLRGGKEDTS